MISESFEMKINSQKIVVNGVQIEVDKIFESATKEIIVEAKNHTCDDFNIHQLYYSYRFFKDKTRKDVHTVFMIYHKGLFRLLEYKFNDPYVFNSCEFVREKDYKLAN